MAPKPKPAAATPEPAAQPPADESLLQYALDTLPEGALVVGEKAAQAGEAFGEYAEDRDELLATPFAYNRTMAKARVPFTILRTGERTLPKMDQPDVMVRKFVYLIELQAPYTYYDESSGNTEEFEAGEQQLIALDVNDVREQDKRTMENLIESYGAIANCALQQYPARKKGHSPSHGIVSWSKWKPLAEVGK